jgi:hypothetical protein
MTAHRLPSDAALADWDTFTINAGTGTGLKIGTSVSEKVGFFNVTPVIQPTAANQADQGVMTTVGANTGTGGAGLSLIGNTSTIDQSAALMNDLVALRDDVNSLDLLLTEVRTALVNIGIIKGS